MYDLNRVSLIGSLCDNARIFLIGNNESIATLSIETRKPQHKTPFKYAVLIENSSMVQFAERLRPGDVVFVEGRLEPICHDTEFNQDHWIVISKTQGLLHPVLYV